MRSTDGASGTVENRSIDFSAADDAAGGDMIVPVGCVVMSGGVAASLLAAPSIVESITCKGVVSSESKSPSFVSCDFSLLKTMGSAMASFTPTIIPTLVGSPPKVFMGGPSPDKDKRGMVEVDENC